jgi:hypothetical protein
MHGHTRLKRGVELRKLEREAAERIVSERLECVNMPSEYRYLLIDCVLAGVAWRDEMLLTPLEQALKVWEWGTDGAETAKQILGVGEILSDSFYDGEAIYFVKNYIKKEARVKK